MTADLGPATTPRPIESPEDRMRDARTDTTDRSFAAYLTAQERDQLDARAATAEQERDDALDDRDAYKEARDVLRKQLDAMKAAKKRALGRLEKAEHVIDLIRDGQEQIDRALAVYDTTPSEEHAHTLGTSCPVSGCRWPMPEPHEDPARLRGQLAEAHADCARYATERDEARAALANPLRKAAEHLRLLAEDHAADSLGFGIGWAADALDAWAKNPDEDAATPGLGSLPPRAQDWEQRAIDAAATGLGEAWSMLATDPTAARRLATAAVRAVIDAGLAGDGGRCRKCGSGFPRTLPADQDPLCWTCGSEEQTGLDEYAPARAQGPEPQYRPATAADMYATGYHWGRAWSPTSDEATCPCPKAPCGYVIRSADARPCELHGPTQTMRGGHPADRCPGAPS